MPKTTTPAPTSSRSRNQRVCIVWRDDPTADTVNTLIYRGPNPGIRTYAPDGIDGRCGNPPLLTDDAEIRTHLREHTGADGMIAIPVESAIRLFGWKRSEFSD